MIRSGLFLIGLAALVLASVPRSAEADQVVFVLSDNGTIYDVAANGTTGTFKTGLGGFCMTRDSSGNLYVNNAAWTLSKVTTAGTGKTTTGGNVSTFATGLYNPNSIAISPAPEPATLTLLALGGLLALRRRRSK